MLILRLRRCAQTVGVVSKLLHGHFCAVVAAMVSSWSIVGANAADAERGFTMASGFQIEQIATTDLAFDIQALTLDAEGRVVVSGPGYIRVLMDRDDDGLLDHAREIYSGPARGAMGLLADGRGIYFVGGEGLHRLDDHDGDGFADGEPTLLLPISATGEHDAHGVRRGADGFLYLIVGNSISGHAARVQGAVSPVLDPYAGTLLRLGPGGSSFEVLAHGLRNTYDFDFDAFGEVIAWDSDGERDEGLPWYRGARFYHLTAGADAGWRSSGSGKLPPHAWDTAAPAGDVGRASPTGVVVYRHDRFPPRYRGGVFALDWTFGRVLFAPLKARDGTYDTPWEGFVQGDGDVPFAPTDIDVSPDGALIVASGGRGLPGGVFRIAATSSPRVDQRPDGRHAAAGAAEDRDAALARVLRAPMPLSAWSRARWVSAAKVLRSQMFLSALASPQWTPAERVRALDAIVEIAPGSAPQALARVVSLGDKAPPRLAARAAWWAGRLSDTSTILAFLGRDDPWIARTSVEAAISALATNERAALVRSVFRHASASSRRVRQGVAAFLAHLRSEEVPPAVTTRERLVRGLASVLRSPWGKLSAAAVHDAHAVLISSDLSSLAVEPRGRVMGRAAADREARLDALRLIEMAFERLQPKRDARAAFYEAWDAVQLGPYADVINSLDAERIVRLVSSKDAALSRQAARLVALLGLGGEDGFAAVMDRLGLSTPPGEDILTLSYLAWSPELTDAAAVERLTDAFLGLSWKVQSGRVARDQRWHRFLQIVATRLFSRRPQVATALVADGRFGSPDDISLTLAMDEAGQQQALAKILARPFPTAADDRRRVVMLLARFPTLSRDALHALVDDEALITTVLDALASAPTVREADVFRRVLEEGDRNVVGAAARGLAQLAVPAPASEAFEVELLALLRWAYVLDADTTQIGARDAVAVRIQQLASVLSTQSPEVTVGAQYEPEAKTTQRAAIDAWRQLFELAIPELKAELEAIVAELKSDEERVRRIVQEAQWESGDAARGAAVFERLSCHSCHHVGGRGVKVGPDLAGIGSRFGPGEIVLAIGLPNRDVPDRYRAETIVLRSGETLAGLAVYDSRQAVLLRTRSGDFRRVATEDMALRVRSDASIMPTGLLERMNLAEIVDLVAYLRAGSSPRDPATAGFGR